MDQIKSMEKNGDLSEDDTHRLAEDIQKVTDEFIKKVDETLSQKENEIMSV